jgi:hypothetical protein
MYKREDVYKATLEYFKGDTLATDVWINKYSLKDTIDGGRIDDNTTYFELTPNDMHKRLAKELHRIENKYVNPLSEEVIFDLIKDFKYIIPQGSPMSGIGNDMQTVSLSNCFVVGNEADSYGGIFLIDQEQAQLMKRRGGVGHDLSHIRPKGMRVKNSALTSTGIVPFMERFSNTTEEVAQDGRRGALMLTCFSEKTFILTDQGWLKIVDVIEKYKNGDTIKAWTHEGYRDIIDTQEFENRDIYEVEVENGNKIEVTGNHEFMVKNIETGEEYLKKIIDINVDIEELILYV